MQDSTGHAMIINMHFFKFNVWKISFTIYIISFHNTNLHNTDQNDLCFINEAQVGCVSPKLP